MKANALLPLHVENLNLSIQGQLLLSDINLTVASGGISAILGHNGAGKSLLLRVLHGLTAPSGGSVYWGGNSIAQPAVRRQQSMVFQKPVLLRRSVAANIEFVHKLHRNNCSRSVDQLLELADLADKSHQPARTLSGGEQQRLAFARALASDPAVMFLDEPSANLDPDATVKIERLIHRAAKQSVKIFLVTHDIGQARRLAEDIVFLNRGKIAEFATAEDFFNRPQSRHSQSFINGVLSPPAGASQ